jgi:hypothetical protein
MELEFDFCNFRTLPPCIGRLVKLEKLTICHCTIELLPDEIRRLPDLKTLILQRDAEIVQSWDLLKMENLTEIRFEECHNFPTAKMMHHICYMWCMWRLKRLDMLRVANAPWVVELPATSIGQLRNLETLRVVDDPDWGVNIFPKVLFSLWKSGN